MTSRSEIAVGKSFGRAVTRAVACVAFAILLVGYVPYSSAQEQGQQTFHSAAEAGSALFAAAQNDDQKALLDILGPSGKDIISSGDPLEDSNNRTRFVVKYQQMHRYAKDAAGNIVLYVGAENWPLPIPLVSKDGVWYFDTESGKQEILMRRVGQNELTALDACHQLVDAEKQYFAKALPGKSSNYYAERFVSDKGKHNGLFWSETGDEFESLVDPLIASAGQETAKSNGYLAGAAGDPVPFNGYYFRILMAQGANAPGGATNYVVDGSLVKGFAIAAYPAEYRSSGVMTFIVNDSGVVYEKDLGPDTTEIAGSMTAYNPDSSWRPAEQ